MSEYKFKITYRNEDKYGHYWGDNRYTVSIIAETLERAKQKLDEIEKNDYDMHKRILAWEAEEITEEKDKEIERLNNIINELKEWFKGYHKSYASCKWYEEDYTEFIEHLENELKGSDK